MNADQQLTLDIIVPRRDGPPLPLYGALKLKGALQISRDLNIGDEVTIVVIDVRSGEELATGHARMDDHAKIKAQYTEGRHVADEREHVVTVAP